MIDKSFLESKYKKEEVERILKINSLIGEKFSEEKELIKDCEEILKIIIGLKLDEKSVCAGLLFPFIKDNRLTFEEVGTDDKELLMLLNMLIKCEELSSNYTDADGLKEMLLAITKDIRVIIIKSAEMLVFARKNVKNYNDEVVIKKFKDWYERII